jgi:hypothetical protein
MKQYRLPIALETLRLHPVFVLGVLTVAGVIAMFLKLLSGVGK